MNFFTALNRAAPYAPGMAAREAHSGHRSPTGPHATPKSSPVPRVLSRRSRRLMPYIEPTPDVRALRRLAPELRKDHE